VNQLGHGFIRRFGMKTGEQMMGAEISHGNRKIRHILRWNGQSSK
jgi:hypothetical protein